MIGFDVTAGLRDARRRGFQLAGIHRVAQTVGQHEEPERFTLDMKRAGQTADVGSGSGPATRAGVDPPALTLAATFSLRSRPKQRWLRRAGVFPIG